EFGPALAQQRFQGLHGRGGAGDAAEGRQRLLVGGRAVALVAAEAERLRQLGADVDRLLCRIWGLRGLLEASLSPLPGFPRAWRRSSELSGGGLSPVCEPGPAVPWPMPGLSSSASAGSIGGSSGRDALARVGFAGSFFECLAGSRLGFCDGLSGGFGIAGIWR